MNDTFDGWLAYLERRLARHDTEAHQLWLQLEHPPETDIDVQITAQSSERPEPEIEDIEALADPQYWSPYCKTPV